MFSVKFGFNKGLGCISSKLRVDTYPLTAIKLIKKGNITSCVNELLNSYREAGTKTTDEHITSTMKGRENLDRFEKTLSELIDALGWSKSYPFSSKDLKCWENKVSQYLRQLGNNTTKRFSCWFIRKLTFEIYGLM